MQASVSEARSRFSYHVLARLMYLDQHYVLQVNKWEGMRHRCGIRSDIGLNGSADVVKGGRSISPSERIR
jgi:hypothetical protein